MIEIMFCVSIVLLCRIELSFSNISIPHEKSFQLHRKHTINTIESNGPNFPANTVQSFGDETMRSVIEILYRHKKFQEKSIDLHRTGLNNTITSDQSYMIFNRNAKSGSESLRLVISMLSKKNNFTMVRDRHAESILSEQQRRYFFHLWKGSENQNTAKCKKTSKLKHSFTKLPSFI